MNKKLIALALAALPVAAMADVTIYGSIREGIESNKTYADPASTSGSTLHSNTEVNDWTSRIGFKGNEDLGNGLKAIWQVESRLHPDVGGDQLGTRDTFIGLSGNFGTVRLGKLSNFANSDMEQVDPGYYSGNSVGGLGMFTRLDGRVKNAVRYDSPTFAGFSGMLLWGADESRTDFAGTNRINNQTVNVGLSYENSGFFGKYNYEHWGDAQEAASTDSWHRLEAGYNANNIYVALGYQRVTTYNIADFYNKAVLGIPSDVTTVPTSVLGAGAGKATTKEWALTGGYTFGALTPYLSFAKGQKVSVEGLGSIDNSGYKQWVLGANYDLSKRTAAYASYGNVKWDDSSLQTEHSFGVGLIHNF